MVRIKSWWLTWEIPPLDDTTRGRIKQQKNIVFAIQILLLFTAVVTLIVEIEPVRRLAYSTLIVVFFISVIYQIKLQNTYKYSKLVRWCTENGFEITRFEFSWGTQLLQLENDREELIKMKTYQLSPGNVKDGGRDHIWFYMQSPALPKQSFRILKERVLNNRGYPIRQEYSDFRYLEDYIITSDDLDLTQLLLENEMRSVYSEFDDFEVDFVVISGKQIKIETSMRGKYGNIDPTDAIDFVYRLHNLAIETDAMAFVPMQREFTCLNCGTTKRVARDFCTTCDQPLPRCVICLNDLQGVEPENFEQLPCCSYFVHVDELELWKLRHTSCPVCRTEL